MNTTDMSTTEHARLRIAYERGELFDAELCAQFAAEEREQLIVELGNLEPAARAQRCKELHFHLAQSASIAQRNGREGTAIAPMSLLELEARRLHAEIEHYEPKGHDMEEHRQALRLLLPSVRDRLRDLDLSDIEA
ncbi:MAG TPA: hypothetical protein VFB62_20445 [Polyangiaceae bacterium]|nr:hypothetical protein [Polyangiaceae bacterium]